MVEGYGYSVWYIPQNYKQLQKTYGITHIPHITFQTNFETFDEALSIYHNINPIIKINFCSKIVLFPQMYSNDPLLGCGFYVEKNSKLNPEFDPHLTTKYFVKDDNEINSYLDLVNSFDVPNEEIYCFKAISDNRNIDSTTWEIIKQE